MIYLDHNATTPVAPEVVAGARSGLEHFLGIGADCTNMRIDLRETEFHCSRYSLNASAIAAPSSAGDLTVMAPALSSAAYFSAAVPLPPEMIAPA